MPKPTILYIGESIKYNQKFYEGEFLSRFNVIRSEEKDRVCFIDALKTKKYGDFSATHRPHFQTEGEMGQWDAKLIPLLPPSVRIFARVGAGFNWADTDVLGQHKIWYANGAGASDEEVSDTALYMILSIFRNFTRSQFAARTTDPEIFNATHKLIPTISHNPRGHILGIIGLGNISKKFAYKARTALGMEIHYFDVVRASVDEEHRLVATFHASLDKLLKGRGLHIPPYNSECIYTRSDRCQSSCIDEARI